MPAVMAGFSFIRLILRSGCSPLLEGWGGHPISGLPEIGTFIAQVG
jgi:hypothetical protein